MLVFLTGMPGFSLTGDLFNLYVFFELMSTTALALCGLKLRELLGHALIKSALFFVAGILLHKLRTASEPALFAKVWAPTFPPRSGSLERLD